MGGMSSVAGGGDFWHGALEGAIIGGVSAAIAAVAPVLEFSVLFSMASGGFAGAVIDYCFQSAEAGMPLSFSQLELARLLRAMGGGAVGAFYIQALARSEAIADAIYAAIISSELTELYGCIDIAANATQSSNNNQASQTSS